MKESKKEYRIKALEKKIAKIEVELEVLEAEIQEYAIACDKLPHHSLIRQAECVKLMKEMKKNRLERLLEKLKSELEKLKKGE